MTLPSSGTITMAQVATELGISATGLNLNDSRVRTLAGKASGAIGFSDLRGKSAVAFPLSAISALGAGDAGDVTAHMTLTRAGALNVSVNGGNITNNTSGPTAWISPATGTSGDSYWCKAVVSSGGFTSGSAVGNTLLALSSTRDFFCTATYGSSVGCTGTLYIYSDSGGTVQVGSCSFSLSASY